MEKPYILLTNDDGIDSPGLWAAAEKLSHIGFVTVVAPREQASGAGRSLPSTSDGIIQEKVIEVNGQEWKAYSVGGSPAQAVEHAILEIMDIKPSLVVSGINYGENVATGITISGTVGAAMEAASMGIPALAMSLETDPIHHRSHSTTVDFSIAAYFTAYFGKLLLEKPLPIGVDLIKVDVPAKASIETAWEWTRLSTQRYYAPTRPKRTSWDIPKSIGYKIEMDYEVEPHDSDVFTLIKKQLVSVTPITLDMTSIVDLQTLSSFAAHHPDHQ